MRALCMGGAQLPGMNPTNSDLERDQAFAHSRAQKHYGNHNRTEEFDA
jgi:hypothetical protein